jgi:hypothetical protein
MMALLTVAKPKSQSKINVAGFEVRLDQNRDQNLG